MENQKRNNNERGADTNRKWMDNLMKHMEHLQKSSSTVKNSETKISLEHVFGGELMSVLKADIYRMEQRKKGIKRKG